MNDAPLEVPSRLRAEQPAAISRLIVQIVTDLVGRGPTQIRTEISETTVTVVMRDTLTKAERTLAAGGSSALVVSMRRALQSTMAPALIPGIEAITGRRVYAFLSDHSLEPDVSVETFVLAGPNDAMTPLGGQEPAGR